MSITVQAYYKVMQTFTFPSTSRGRFEFMRIGFTLSPDSIPPIGHRLSNIPSYFALSSGWWSQTQWKRDNEVWDRINEFQSQIWFYSSNSVPSLSSWNQKQRMWCWGTGCRCLSAKHTFTHIMYWLSRCFYPERLTDQHANTLTVNISNHIQLAEDILRMWRIQMLSTKQMFTTSFILHMIIR